MTKLNNIVEKYGSLIKLVSEKTELFDLAVDVLESEDTALIWLISPQANLNNEPPITQDIDKVKSTLLALEHEVYL